MPGAQIPTSVTRLESMLGYQAVSLTNFDSSALSAIAAGSKVEIAGAFFTFTVDETINATSWTAITTGNTAYIALIPAGTAGSQTVTASYTATAPVWSTSKQGWYASAGSSTRVIGSARKAEATSQLDKIVFDGMNSQNGHKTRIYLTTGTFLVPANVSEVWITGCAAGGNGGTGGAGGTSGGGGGGGGELVWKKKIPVTAGAAIAVSIGGAGSTTSFGTTVLNHGVNGVNGASGGAGGAGGALSLGDEAGGAGGDGGTNSSWAGGTSTSFSNGGLAGAYYAGGGGGASIGMFASYRKSTAGVGGGAGGAFGGGGGGGLTGGGAGIGGTGGYGGGGGGGAVASSAGGAGGPAIIIVEW
jgi:hypothetical protein